jgi:hypothetical protein
MRRHTVVRQSVVLSAALCAVLLVAGCKSSNHPKGSVSAPPALVQGGNSATASATPPPSAVASAVTAPSAVASTSAPPSAAVSSPAAEASSGGPTTSLDPCQLVTKDEASGLTGVSFGDGAESTTEGGRICTYGGQTTNVFMVLVAQGTDSSAADAVWSQEEAKAQALMTSQIPAGVAVTAPTLQDVSGIADRAAIASGSATIAGQTISISAIYLLKGATFLTYSDLALNKAAPTAAALEAQAAISLARVS